MVGRQLLVLFAVAAGFGLSGCSGSGLYSQASVQQPGQEVLDGTVRNAADWSDEPSRAAAPRRSARTTRVDAVGSTGMGSSEPPKVFSDEWWAKENRENERLKRQMTICRGC
jgi:hypothetical protein